MNALWVGSSCLCPRSSSFNSLPNSNGILCQALQPAGACHPLHRLGERHHCDLRLQSVQDRRQGAGGAQQADRGAQEKGVMQKAIRQMSLRRICIIKFRLETLFEEIA